MQKCSFNGKFIYAFDVIGDNNTILNDREKEWRKASEENLLKCDECGHPVILRIRDLNKRKPHFSHKVVSGITHECQYSRESEEHIEGKRILFRHMQEHYSDACCEIRHRFSSQCIADLYFVFEDGSKLAIEFQRLNTKIEIWDKKHKYYKDNGISDLWIFSGREGNLEELKREYELNYYKRIILNDLNDKIAFLNVESCQMTLVSKIVIKDEQNGRILYDRIFSKTYPLSEVEILKDGSIKSSFEREYDIEKDRAVHEYKEMIESEKSKGSFLDMVKNSSVKSRIHLNYNDHIPAENKVVGSNKSDRPELRGLFGEIYDYEIKKAIKTRKLDNLSFVFDKCARDAKTLEAVRAILDSHIKNGEDYAELIQEKLNETGRLINNKN